MIFMIKKPSEGTYLGRIIKRAQYFFDSLASNHQFRYSIKLLRLLSLTHHYLAVPPGIPDIVIFSEILAYLPVRSRILKAVELKHEG